MLCGQAVPLAPWREVWARLAEAGLTADGVTLHYAVDAGCGFSVRLGLGERSVTVHGTAAVRGRQLAAMELVEPPDWLRRLAPEPSGIPPPCRCLTAALHGGGETEVSTWQQRQGPALR